LPSLQQELPQGLACVAAANGEGERSGLTLRATFFSRVLASFSLPRLGLLRAPTRIGLTATDGNASPMAVY